MTLRQTVILISIFFFNVSFNNAENSTLNITSGEAENRNIRIVNVTVKNPIRDWEDTSKIFFGNYSDHLNVHIIHTNEECPKIRTNKIKASNDFQPGDKLSFHKKHGKNVITVNAGKTVQKITFFSSCGSGYNLRLLDTATFTNRPLKDSEIFQVKIEKLTSCYKENIGEIAIGVVGISPDNIQKYHDLANWKSGDIYTCIYMSEFLYGNCSYAKVESNRKTGQLSEGDTIGVMRSESGTLHFFLKGYPVVSLITGVPSKVYGYFDLQEKGDRASIVHLAP